MIIWIFLATISLPGGKEINMSPDNNKFAFATKAACEYAIAESKMLKCVPLTLLGAK